MRIKFPAGTFILTILVFILLWFIMNIATSCQTTKHVQQSHQSVDSLYKDSLLDEIKTRDLEISNYKSTLSQLDYLTANFNSKCDTVFLDKIIKSGCEPKSIDSLLTILRATRNTVRQYADGSIELQGNINSVSILKNKLLETVSEKTKENDSLKRKLSTMQGEKHTQTDTKVKDVKRGVPLWLFALCFIGGCVFWNFLGGKLKSLLNFIK